jgi:hypothetical protein
MSALRILASAHANNLYQSIAAANRPADLDLRYADRQDRRACGVCRTSVQTPLHLAKHVLIKERPVPGELPR